MYRCGQSTIFLCLVVALTLWTRPIRGQPSFEFTFDVPSCDKVVANRLEATARIVSRNVSAANEGIEAWSMAIRTSGCIALGAKPAAEFPGDPLDAFVHIEWINERVLMAVILGLESRVTLPIDQGIHDVFSLDLVKTPFCSCRMEYVDGLIGTARAVDNVVTADAKTVKPTLNRARVACDAPVCTTPPMPLEEDVRLTLSAAIDACIDRSCFAIDPPPGKPVILRLSDTDETNANQLFVRWGQPATPIEFDQSSTIAKSSAQDIFIPEARAQTLFVLVDSPTRLESSEVTLTAFVTDLFLRRASPRRGTQGLLSGLTVFGAGFVDGETEFRLRSVDTGETIPAEGALILSKARAELVFQLDAPFGRYDVEAFVPSRVDPPVDDPPSLDSAILKSAFEITERVDDVLTASLTGQARNGRTLENIATLAYENEGNRELTAPILKIDAPRLCNDPRSQDCFMELRMERETRWQKDSLLVFGIDPVGTAGDLAPGNPFSLPVLFRSSPDWRCPFGRTFFEVRVFSPPEESLVDWDAMEAPPGVTEGWPDVRTQLRELMGDRWIEFHEHLSHVATRLNRRGVESGSVLELLRFCVREARGSPTAAAVGQIVDSQTLEPLPEVEVAAFDQRNGESVVVSTALTDKNGEFALDWLENDRMYELRARGRAETLEFTVPAMDDRFGLELGVGPDLGGAPFGPGANVDEAGLPTGPPSALMKGNLYSPIEHLWETRIVCAIDPNDKGGSDGELPEGFDIARDRAEKNIGGFVGAGTRVEFGIDFENIGSAAAKGVIVTDPVSAVFDLDTFEFLNARWGEHTIGLDRALGDIHSGYHGSVDFPPAVLERGAECVTPAFRPHCIFRSACGTVVDENGGELVVGVEGTLNCETREIRWEFKTLKRTRCGADGNCVMVPEDDIDFGFLPGKPEGDMAEECVERCGRVTFAVETRGDLANEFPEDAPLPNEAEITFVSFEDDGEGEAIATRVWRNFFSTFQPAEEPRNPKPASGAEGVDPFDLITWEPQPRDRVAERGGGVTDVYSYEIQIWERKDGVEALVHEAAGLRLPQFQPTKLRGERDYKWQVIAKNRRNEPTPGPSWFFTTKPESKDFVRGDPDANGRINLADTTVILRFLFTGELTPRCERAADTNDDNRVDLTDALFLLLFLFDGGPEAPPPSVCGPDPTPPDPADALPLICVSFPRCQ